MGNQFNSLFYNYKKEPVTGIFLGILPSSWSVEQGRSSHQLCSIKELFLKILHYSQETFVLQSLFNKVNIAKILKAHSQVWGNFWQLKVLLKWWKMLFFSPQKLFSFSRYLNFCLHFLVMQQSNWIRKVRLISNFMTSQPG